MTRRRKAGQKRRISSAQKVSTDITERVKKVGPENFGILAIDPSKKSAACTISNFYGDLLMPLQEYAKNAIDLMLLVIQTKQIMIEHKLLDLVVALESSGSFYQVIKRTLKQHWTVKLIHPFTTKQLRQPADPHNKTDATDAKAMTKSIMIGYGFSEENVTLFYEEWRIISRFRKDLVEEQATHKIQCLERIEHCYPGYTSLFKGFWDHKGNIEIIKAFSSAKQIGEAGADAIKQKVADQGIKITLPVICKIISWANNALQEATSKKTRRRIIRDELEIIFRLNKKIDEYEFEMLKFLIKSTAIVLLGIRGINVVSASQYASELGPISNYFNPKRITGRAGIFPSRIQSADFDNPNGPLAKGHNARLRGALMNISFNLCKYNTYIKGWLSEKKSRKKMPDTGKKRNSNLRAAVACKFTGISFNMLAGHKVFNHPQAGRGDAILIKIIEFCKNHKVHLPALGKLLRTAVDNLPEDSWLLEAKNLENTIKKSRKGAHKIYFDNVERKQLVDYIWSRINQKMEDSQNDIS